MNIFKLKFKTFNVEIIPPFLNLHLIMIYYKKDNIFFNFDNTIYEYIDIIDVYRIIYFL